MKPKTSARCGETLPEVQRDCSPKIDATFDEEAFPRAIKQLSELRSAGTLTKERWLDLIADGERAAGDMPFNDHQV